ncbi:ParE family toxin-like protein [Nitrospirillum bahiense]|uniref:ParE-like toxin domain-containing protein n=1 Tax=Nitrospirillum amazonense TaxID=28077 RepID=A0A560FMQ1_9PROT|nr:hypothetical protein FBZ88_11540 [Nitrospirillum amazonense]
MQSRATKGFWRLYRQLPRNIRKSAKRAYVMWKMDPQYAALHFKRLNTKEPMYSIRVGLHYRALGLSEGDTIYWFWIGTHADYDTLIR